ncbi:MAG: DUF4129 domain-containing protein [Pseudomonadota bacterium]|nr:DUF4129 domain-containing protein [Pseudomonadota bacterium]
MGQGQIRAATEAVPAVDQDFASAHQALKADPAIQFNLTPTDPPPKPPAWLKELGEWLDKVLKPLGKFFDWIGSLMPDAPFARFLLWTVLAIAAATLLALIFMRLRHGEWRLPWGKREAPDYIAADEEEWRPEAAPVRGWLDEADALAAQGRFAEAIHHLLLRSIDDIARRRPRLVRPALTSRELSGSDVIPSAARELFSAIARLVERSLFGGREVGPADWERARNAYADFALAKAWQA